MCTSKQSFANFGLATLSVANSNLDGTGTVSTVLTGASTGTIINQIIIKATGNTSEGMVRLFIDDGVNVLLYKEVSVPASVQSAVEQSFQAVIVEDLILNSGYILKASTQVANNFNVIANGTTWVQCDCGSSDACCAQTHEIVNTAVGNVNTANSNLDGTGTLTNIFTSQTGALNGGSIINSVNIKATGSTSEGMVRLFVDDGGGGVYLVAEVPIAASVQSSIEPAYRSLSTLGLYINPGYSLKASTQVGDTFNVRSDSTDIINCDCVA